VAGSISGPIIRDVLGFRAGGRYYSYGGQYRNQLTGRRVGGEESKSAYLTLVAKPTDNVQIRLRGQYQHDDDDHIAAFFQGAEANNCKPGVRSPAFKRFSPALPGVPAVLGSTNTNQYFCGEIKAQPNNVRLNNEPILINPTLGVRDGTAFDGVESKTFLVSSVIDWDIGGSGFVLSSLTGYRDYMNRFGSDSDFSEAFTFFGPIAPATVEPTFANTNRDDVWDVSQELRIASPTDRRYRFLLGAYYFKLEYQSVDLTFANPLRGEPLGSLGSEANTIEDRAVFGLVGLDVTDALSITGELRYSEEKKTAIDRGGFCAGYGSLAATFARTTPCGAGGKFTGTDPRITIDYKTPGGALIYAIYAQGRKPGGFNGSAGVAFGSPRYEQETARGGELGVKFDALDNTLRMSVSAYYNKLSDYQLSTSAPLPGSPRAITSIVTNSGDARTQGIEIEAQAAPAEGLTLSFGYSYVDAKFTRGCDADQFILNSGGYRPNFNTLSPPAAAVPLCSIKGNRLPLAAPHTVNGSLSFEQPLNSAESLRFFTTTSFSFEDKRFVQVDNLAYGGDAFLLNARLGLRTDSLSIALFGRNLTDEDSVPLPSRWFDLRYGAGSVAPDSTFNGAPLFPENGNPRAFFGVLRKGRTFGVEATARF
jgi:outer membrane receptor protein involved in Fe transport